MKNNIEMQTETITRVKAVESKSAVSSTCVQSSLSKIQQKDPRKTNIVIYNLEEPTSEEGSGHIEQDLTKVDSILQTL